MGVMYQSVDGPMGRMEKVNAKNTCHVTSNTMGDYGKRAGAMAKTTKIVWINTMIT